MPTEEKKSEREQEKTGDLGTINTWGPEMQDGKKPAHVRGDFRLHYPYTWHRSRDFAGVLFDEHGIPNWKAPRSDDVYYDPALVAAFGLFEFSQFRNEGDVRARYTAMRMADWLVDHLETWQQNCMTWPMPAAMPFYGLQPRWVSAKIQSLAISLLLRLAYINNDAKYEEAAAQAVRLFFVSVAEGGVAQRFPDGTLAFEQFPAAKPVLPLSGNLFALIGLHEYVRYFEDHAAQTLIDGALNGLKENLLRYDTGKWVLFDLHKSRRCAAPAEIKSICRLLNTLVDWGADAAIGRTASKWQGYLVSGASKRAYWLHRAAEWIRLHLMPARYGITRKDIRGAPR